MNDDETVSFDAQYALRNACGLVHLANWSSVTLTGADRQRFLNNFCTNDVKRLIPGESCEAFFCNVKGRIIGHGLVTCRDEELVVIGPPGQGAALAGHLDRYVIREDVTVLDTTAERALLLVLDARDNCVNVVLPILDYSSAKHEPLAKLQNFPALIADVHVYSSGWFKLTNQFAVLFETSLADCQTLQHELAIKGAVVCECEAFETVRIETGMPLFGTDFDDHNLPQEVGRNAQAISFTKGCYLGQETVARIDALGHVNQQIVGVAFSGREVPPVGAELTHNGASVGRVTSATFSPALDRPLALAMVRREHNAVGSQLESPMGACEVVVLPVTARPAAS